MAVSKAVGSAVRVGTQGVAAPVGDGVAVASAVAVVVAVESALSMHGVTVGVEVWVAEFLELDLRT